MFDIETELKKLPEKSGSPNKTKIEKQPIKGQYNETFVIT